MPRMSSAAETVLRYVRYKASFMWSLSTASSTVGPSWTEHKDLVVGDVCGCGAAHRSLLIPTFICCFCQKLREK